jgi:hypothetical protein
MRYRVLNNAKNFNYYSANRINSVCVSLTMTVTYLTMYDIDLSSIWVNIRIRVFGDSNSKWSSIRR